MEREKIERIKEELAKGKSQNQIVKEETASRNAVRKVKRGHVK